MPKTLTTVGLIALLLTAPVATGSASAAQADTSPAQAEAPMADPTIDIVAVNGSGCPQGTARVTMSDDRTSFLITYSAFAVSAGPGAKATDSRQNCQMALNINPPAGYVYDVAQIDYIGTANIADGASARLRTNYYWQGSPADNWVTHTMSGPMFNVWRMSDVAQAAGYAPCGERRYFNINTELRLDKGSSSGASRVALYVTDGGATGVYHISPRRCG